MPIIIQAARVTNACNSLIATGPEIRARPLQYVNTSQIDLDSYVTLTQSVRMRVGVALNRPRPFVGGALGNQSTYCMMYSTLNSGLKYFMR